MISSEMLWITPRQNNSNNYRNDNSNNRDGGARKVSCYYKHNSHYEAFRIDDFVSSLSLFVSSSLIPPSLPPSLTPPPPHRPMPGYPSPLNSRIPVTTREHKQHTLSYGHPLGITSRTYIYSKRYVHYACYLVHGRVSIL